MRNLGSVTWRSRGYLPHFDAPGFQQHIVFGLADALPDTKIPGDAETRSRAADAALDRGGVGCLLADERCAAIVQEELLRSDASRYRLLAWCIMPNHVHAVIEQILDLPGTVRRWKSWTARGINAVTGRTGVVWRREYFDRFARNERHLAVMIHYVESNPVAAGLVVKPEEWPWSSAGFRQLAGQGPGGPS